MINPLIIGLTGPAGSGKDTVADILQAETGAGRLAFADALRAEIVSAFGIDPALLTDRASKERATPQLALSRCNDPRFLFLMGRRFVFLMGRRFPESATLDELQEPRSPRHIMQWWGTDYRRHIFSDDWWVRIAHASILRARERRPSAPIVITDVRFANEAAMVRELGGVIWQVSRPGRDAISAAHESESTGAQFAPKCLIDNRLDVGYLRAQVREAWHACTASAQATPEAAS
ncbi:MAG: hypothetical protein WA917_13755 [Comamonas sp.]